MVDSVAELNDRRLSSAEDDIKQLTRNVTILTQDVQAMLKTQTEIAALIREQAVQSRDIKQANDLAELALRRHDELKVVVDDLKTQLKVQSAVSQARFGMAGAVMRYWPAWAALASAMALGIAYLYRIGIPVGR